MINSIVCAVLLIFATSALAIDSTNLVTADLISRLNAKDPSLSGETIRAALIQIGNSGDKSLRPLLEKYLSESETRRPSSEAGCAQIALAKLGDEEAFAQIVEETKAHNPIVYHEAFIKLGMIGNEKAIDVLGEYLFVDQPPRVSAPQPGPHGETPQDILKSFAPSYLAAQEFAKLFKVERPTKTNPDFYGSEDIQKWRQWWLRRKSTRSN